MKGSLCLIAAASIFASVSAASADPYGEQIRSLEDSVARCFNQHGHAACEQLRRQNLQSIETLYRQQQQHGFAPYSTPYAFTPQYENGPQGYGRKTGGNRRCRTDSSGREYVLPPDSTEGEAHAC